MRRTIDARLRCPAPTGSNAYFLPAILIWVFSLLASCTAQTQTPEFDLVRAASTASSVCQFVADAFNHRQMDRIAVKEITVGRDSKRVSIETEGSCPSPYIRFEDENLSGSLRTESPDDPQPEDIVIVPFRGIPYFVTLVDNAPYQVIGPPAAFSDDALGGTICGGFKRTFKPTLVEDRSPRVCKKFLNGELTDEVDWQYPPGEGNPPQVVMNLGYTSIWQFAEVSLNNSGKVSRIGHYMTASTGGCGYELHGVTLLDGDGVSKGEANLSLLDAQSVPYGRTDANLLHTEDKTYVHVWSYPPMGSEDRPRTLLELAEGKFRPVCRVEPLITIEPSP